MAPPPDSIDKAYQIMKASYIDTLTNNAADALIAGEVRASNLLRIPLNFNLINSRAVSATLDYRQTLERFGGSDVTEIGEDGVARRVFKPWLNDMIQSDKDRVGQIVQDAVKQGTLPEKALEEVFANQEHNATLTAYQETKALYNKGTFDRFSHESVQQATWKHMDPQPDPREEHQALDGQVFDLDDPIWALLDEPNCHCQAIPVLNFGSIGNLMPVNNADEEGTWVTINGAHILIKDGETIGDAFERTTGKSLPTKSYATPDNPDSGGYTTIHGENIWSPGNETGAQMIKRITGEDMLPGENVGQAYDRINKISNAPKIVPKSSINPNRPEYTKTEYKGNPIEMMNPRYIRPPNEIPIKGNEKYAKIKESMDKQGYQGRPLIVIDEGGGQYYGLTGSHRLRAARDSELDKVPVIVVPSERLSESQLTRITGGGGNEDYVLSGLRSARLGKYAKLVEEDLK